MIGIIFIFLGIIMVLVCTPMVIRSIYAQLPRRLHRSFGISAWFLALGWSACGLAVLGLGVAFALEGVNQRLSEQILAAYSLINLLVYFLLAIAVAALGLVIFFVGRMVARSHH